VVESKEFEHICSDGTGTAKLMEGGRIVKKKKSAKTKTARNLPSKTLNAKHAARVKGGIGSATGGAGAGKIKFNEFTIKSP